MIVFDSSTIILLAKVELLDIVLRTYRGGVAVTEEVLAETTAKNTFDALLIKKRVEEGKIQVKKVADKRAITIMDDFNIHTGEAESIILAMGEKALLATDDKNALTACKLLDIRFATAIDFLVRAKEKGLLGAEGAAAALAGLARYGRYSKDILSDAKRRLG